MKFIGLTLNADMDEKTSDLDRQLPKPKGQLLQPTSYRNLVRLIAENAKLNIKNMKMIIIMLKGFKFKFKVYVKIPCMKTYYH